MKKVFGAFLLVSLLAIPVFAFAQNPIVPCGNEGQPRCELGHVRNLFVNVFEFIVLYISTPLAGLLIVIGGVMILISGGNPNMISLGRRMLWGALIGIALIWGSYLIINSLLQALGYVGV